MNAAGPGAIDLRAVKRDSASRRIVADWRWLAGGERRRGGASLRTLVACSGGADSTALLLALAASEPEEVAVAHILHDMRTAAEAEADRDFVRAVASQLGRPYVEGPANVAGVAGNAEAAARRVRYLELGRLAGEADAAFVATGHQADDQLESLLMALLRGAGLRGMRGIAAQRPIGGGAAGVTLIRPMLGVTREDAERICRAAGVRWQEDRTNLDVSRLRAAVRSEVLPVLRRLRPGATRRAASTARLMRQAQQVVDRETAEVMQLATVAPEAVSWPRRVLGSEPELLIGEALRAAGVHLGGARGRDRLTSRALLPIVRAIRGASTEPRCFELAGMTVAVTAHTVTASKVEKERTNMSATSETPTVLLVGHCGPDAHLLASAVGRAVPGARVETVNDAKRLESLLSGASLLLVNRVLSADLGGSGVELIRSLRERNGHVPAAMLVSNYEDAQREAEQAGARPGFGKAGVMGDQTRKRIRAALGFED